MQCMKHELAAYCSGSCILCRERVSEWVSASPQSAPVAHLLPLHLSQSLTSDSWSCCRLLVFLRLMVMYSWWRRSLGMIIMAPNFTHGIFDPWSCTGTLWIGDKVLINTSLHPPHICDIQAPDFPLDFCQAAVRACTVILVCSRNRFSGLWFGN